VLSEFQIEHSGQGFEQLHNVFAKLDKLRINIERPDGLLVNWLHSQGWPVYMTPPTIVAKRRTVLFRHNCNHALRHAITDLAALSLRKSGWALSYYRSQLARGHDHTRAIRALANRWLSIMWTLWQHSEFYDEAVHVKNRAERGLPRPALSVA